MAEEVAAGGVPAFSLGMSDDAKLWHLARGVSNLARVIDEHSIDLVHSCLYRANAMAGIAARMSRCRPKVVSAQHSLTPADSSVAAALAVRWTRRLSGCVIAVSEAVRQQLVLNDGVPEERVVMIENGIDTARFSNLDNRRCRKLLGLPNGGIVVLGVGRLAPVKAFHDLIESVGNLRDSGVDVLLVLAGDGPERPRLEEMAQALCLEERVFFLGVRRDMETVFGAADIFVLCSLREAAPAALLEAMASGLAVVATRVGGVPHIVADGVTALLIDPAQPQQLTGQLHRLVGDSELRDQIGSQAKAAVQRRFDIEQMVDRHERLYRAVLAGRELHGAP